MLPLPPTRAKYRPLEVLKTHCQPHAGHAAVPNTHYDAHLDFGHARWEYNVSLDKVNVYVVLQGPNSARARLLLLTAWDCHAAEAEDVFAIVRNYCRPLGERTLDVASVVDASGQLQDYVVPLRDSWAQGLRNDLRTHVCQNYLTVEINTTATSNIGTATGVSWLHPFSVASDAVRRFGRWLSTHAPPRRGSTASPTIVR